MDKVEGILLSYDEASILRRYLKGNVKTENPQIFAIFVMLGQYLSLSATQNKKTGDDR